MFEVPETRYARRGQAHIAYQVVGNGPRDLVLFPSGQYPIDLIWSDAGCASFLQRLTSFSRLILFDLRGWGASDHVDANVDGLIERWAEDITTVLDAVGSQRATLVALSEAGPAGIVFAATYPQRTSALLLMNTCARFARSDDYTCGFPQELVPAFRDAFVQAWGSGRNGELMAPSRLDDRAFFRRWGLWERLTAGPQDAGAMWITFAQADVRDVLSTVRVPTLVLHRVGDTYIRIDHGRYLADGIPQARLVELSGSDHIFFTGSSAETLDEIEEFVTGTRGSPSADRVLATVLFTDIVGSTDRAARGGDRVWRDLLGRHEAAVRSELDRYRGKEIKTTGDGFVATFDGPGRGIRCAVAIRDAVSELGLELRVGLHTGEIEIRGDDIAGMAVHIGQRTAAAADPGEIRVTSTVKDLVAGSGILFSDLGPQRLKGVPEEWRVFTVSAA